MRPSDIHGSVLVAGAPEVTVESIARALVGAGETVVRLPRADADSSGRPEPSLPPFEAVEAVLQGPEPPSSAVLAIAEAVEPTRSIDWIDSIARRLGGPGAVVVVLPRVRADLGPGRDPNRETASAISVAIRSLARTLGPKVRVVGLAPSTEAGPGDAGERDADPVGSAAAFLLSSGARFITGTVLPVDGGAHLRWRLDGASAV